MKRQQLKHGLSATTVRPCLSLKALLKVDTVKTVARLTTALSTQEQSSFFGLKLHTPLLASNLYRFLQ
ncbi:hypothetical protein XacyCFBP1159_15495 [Xanthomonas arboricola pv. corylina]|nr:hypothetical protein XacyCFBP1159_15495 [Xanthomonas arboricola pv. corylina]